MCEKKENILYMLAPFIFFGAVALLIWLLLYLAREESYIKDFDKCMYVYADRQYCISKYEKAKDLK